MKMSKSINDYKEAMDNIKISESFYKRTETLLAELPEAAAEKAPAVGGRRHITAVIMSAAACLICVLGIRLAVSGGAADIITETAADAGGEVSLTESGKEADELIDDFGGYDDGGIVAESIEDSAAGDFDSDGGETDSAPPVPVSSPEETTVRNANPTSGEPETSEKPVGINSVTSSETTAATEKRVVQGIDPYANSGGTDAPEEPAAGPVPSTETDGDIEYDEDDIDITDDEPEVAPADGENGSAEKAALFSELTLDHTTVDVTPYFDMNSIKSGESSVQKSGTEFKPVLELISGMDDYATRIGNSSFTSLFSVRIYNDNIDLDLYSIYLTNNESIVITKHSPDGSQVRETYALRREYYEDIRHWLFLLFGEESDYELFLNLIGGK